MIYNLYSAGKAYRKYDTCIVALQVCTDTPEQWYEVDESQLPPTPEDDEATIEDYEEALGRFGV